jgi:hypothetical protein
LAPGLAVGAKYAAGVASSDGLDLNMIGGGSLSYGGVGLLVTVFLHISVHTLSNLQFNVNRRITLLFTLDTNPPVAYIYL